MNTENRDTKHHVTFREPKVLCMPGRTNGCGKGLRLRTTVGEGQG